MLPGNVPKTPYFGQRSSSTVNSAFNTPTFRSALSSKSIGKALTSGFDTPDLDKRGGGSHSFQSSWNEDSFVAMDQIMNDMGFVVPVVEDTPMAVGDDGYGYDDGSGKPFFSRNYVVLIFVR